MLLTLYPTTIGGLLFLYSLCGEILNWSVSISFSVNPLFFKFEIILPIFVLLSFTACSTFLSNDWTPTLKVARSGEDWIVAEPVTKIPSFSAVGRLELEQDDNKKTNWRIINRVVITEKRFLLKTGIYNFLFASSVLYYTIANWNLLTKFSRRSFRSRGIRNDIEIYDQILRPKP